MIDTFEVENIKGVKYTASLVPDASFVITTPERPFRFLLEVDKGTETLRDIAEKFIKYRYYFQPIHGPSVYEKRYGTDRGRVLCIAPTLQRLKNIKDVCETQGGKTRYWFAVMSELQTTDVFTAPVWYKGGSDEAFSLL